MRERPTHPTRARRDDEDDEDDVDEAEDGDEEELDDEEDDDLLQPTLDAELDVRSFGKLFNPQNILWPCFFGGPFAGGILFGVNYRRMRMPRAALWCWLGSLALGVLLIFAFLVLQRAKSTSEVAATISGLSRLIFVGISVLGGWLVSRHQEPRYAAYTNARRRPQKLFWFGVAAWAGGLVLTVVLGVLLAGALGMLK